MFVELWIRNGANIGISYFSKFDRRCQISGFMLTFLKIRFASFQAVSKFTLTDFDKFCWRCDSAFAVQIIMRRHHFLSTWLYPKLVVFHSFAKRSIFMSIFLKCLLNILYLLHCFSNRMNVPLRGWCFSTFQFFYAIVFSLSFLTSLHLESDSSK
jgi:hypothetical protein